MKEQLYTIPVNDAFDADCECPICAMYQSLEDNAIEYTMGPSYMEDDNRAMTDEMGFCQHHIRSLYEQKNRLGLALILKTHSDKLIKDLKAASNQKPQGSNGLFKKASAPSGVGSYVSRLESTCFICNRINNTYDRYLNTLFHLWKKDSSFPSKVRQCKGFCVYHYAELYDLAPTQLKGKELDDFLRILDDVFFTNMKRVNDDLEWFINKYDYRYQDEPWKNSKDAIPRTIIKTNHQILQQ